MSKQEIINYIMKTPSNTNPAILKSMLESLDKPIIISLEDYSINVPEMVFNNITEDTFPNGEKMFEIVNYAIKNNKTLIFSVKLEDAIIFAPVQTWTADLDGEVYYIGGRVSGFLYGTFLSIDIAINSGEIAIKAG